MTSWKDMSDAAPGLAEAVRSRFDAHRHKTMATLRRDGSPRISGIEALFADGELWLGMMHGSTKALDLLRDPRLALHSATADPEMADGDAKLSGRAVEVTEAGELERFVREVQGASGAEPPGPFHAFRVDVTEVVLIRIGDPADHLLIETWTPGGGLRRVERR